MFDHFERTLDRHMKAWIDAGSPQDRAGLKPLYVDTFADLLRGGIITYGGVT